LFLANLVPVQRRQEVANARAEAEHGAVDHEPGAGVGGRLQDVGDEGLARIDGSLIEML